MKTIKVKSLKPNEIFAHLGVKYRALVPPADFQYIYGIPIEGAGQPVAIYIGDYAQVYRPMTFDDLKIGDRYKSKDSGDKIRMKVSEHGYVETSQFIGPIDASSEVEKI